MTDARSVRSWFPVASGGATVVGPDEPPFCGGWLGWMSYELGAVIEPRAACANVGPGAGPLAMFQRCDGAWCYDKHLGRWWATGACVGQPVPKAGPTDAASRGNRAATIDIAPRAQARGEYEAAVARVIEYIRAGDVYQVNIAHRLAGACAGGLLDVFVDLVRGANPWYGAYLCDTQGGVRTGVLSASPELFLRFDPARRTLVTRPMKGTRASHLAGELLHSEKDRAELAMIVDLMRNDLGRVCELGTVAVEEPRAIETHGALSQAVATVRGRLRETLTLGDAVVACFPPGSVTGAPKIRAMQIIGELEGMPRGAYCGCIGFVSDTGHAEFSVAIRTLVVSGTPEAGRADAVRHAAAEYWVGAGVVADSTPEGEWRETLAKTAALRSIVPGVTPPSTGG